MNYPHENNLLGKIRGETVGTSKHTDLSNLYNAYRYYRDIMQSIDFTAKNLTDFDMAASAIDAYFVQVSAICSTYKYTGQDKLRPTVLEELSVFLFERHPALTSGRLCMYNKKIYAGIVVDNYLNYQIQSKNVDFCIGKEAPISINYVSKTARFPVVCVEAKTYVESTMMHEILFSGTQIKTASPKAKTYVLMEYMHEIGVNHPIPASYAYAVDKMMNLRDCKRSTSNRFVPITPIVGQHLLDYYVEVESNL